MTTVFIPFPIKEGYKKVILKAYKTFGAATTRAFLKIMAMILISRLSPMTVKTPIQTEKLYFTSTTVSSKISGNKNRPCI